MLRVRKRRTCLQVTLAVLLLFFFIGRKTGPALTSPSPDCLRIFQLTHSQLGTNHTIPEVTCGSGALSRPQTEACLRRRAARLGRPARLVLVGDSRNRILQQQLQEFLQLANGTEPEDLGAEDIPRDKFYSVELLSTREMCRKKDKHCSRSVGSELLHLDFWRRPYVYSLFVAKLKEMVLTCRRRPRHCPDLVVLNDAVWYTRRFWLTVKVGPDMFWMMKMREDMVDVASVLRELTELTTVIWRLDESITSEVTNINQKADFQKRITASHSFVYDLRRRVPQLAVWSSCSPKQWTSRIACAAL